MSVRTLYDSEENLRTIVFVINQLAQGRSNGTGTVTLATSGTTTTVTAPTCEANSTVILSPTNSGAAATLTTTYISTTSNGSFVITHTSSGTSRIFRWAIQG